MVAVHQLLLLAAVEGRALPQLRPLPRAQLEWLQLRVAPVLLAPQPPRLPFLLRLLLQLQREPQLHPPLLLDLHL